jgi:transcriptional regulator with PAS, ATPase and Fis domain
VDVRILATSSSDLGELVGQGEFRSDVFYRLGSLIINMPALCQRPDDVISLALLLLDQNKTPKKLSAAAISALAHHTWPGNLRELQNRLRRAGLLSVTQHRAPIRGLGLCNRQYQLYKNIMCKAQALCSDFDDIRALSAKQWIPRISHTGHWMPILNITPTPT